MKTVTDSPDTLVLEEKPWLLGGAVIVLMMVFTSVGIILATSGEIIGGLMFLAGGLIVGGLAFWAFVRHTQLWIDRPSGRVALRSRSLGGFNEQSYPLEELSRAETQLSQSSRGQPTRRAVLVFGGTTGKSVPVTSYYTSGRGPLRTAAAVNAWLSKVKMPHADRS